MYEFGSSESTCVRVLEGYANVTHVNNIYSNLSASVLSMQKPFNIWSRAYSSHEYLSELSWITRRILQTLQESSVGTTHTCIYSEIQNITVRSILSDVGPVDVEELSEIAEDSSDECLSVLTGLEPVAQGVPIALVDKTN